MGALIIMAANFAVCALATATAVAWGIWPAVAIALTLYALLLGSLWRFKRDCEREGVHPPEGWSP